MNPMNPRSPTGAKVEVRIRLKQPILKRQISKMVEKWVQLEHNLSASTFAHPINTEHHFISTEKPVSETQIRPQVSSQSPATDVETLLIRFRR